MPEPNRPTPTDDRERIENAIRLAVLARERCPRPPRWEHAWKRAIWRLVEQANQGTPESDKT